MLEPESQPPLTHIPISFSTRNTPQDLQTAVNKLLSKGAIEPVFHPETKGFSSCLFPGAKEHRGSMSCHRSLPPEWPSGHLQFKMKTQASVRSSIRERECTMSIDIQDAYLCIPMARPIQKCFQFIVIGWVYQFSLAASLWESTKAVRCPQGVNLHVYLDYWLICASPPVQANLVLRVLQHLGWVIHFSKSDLPPRQQFNFIRMQFSMCTYTVTPLPKMGIKIQNTLDHWRSHTLVSPPEISTDFWACWPLWSPSCQEVSFASAQSSDGHQRPGVRRQGPGQTGFQWLRPFSIRWLGGPLLQCCMGSHRVPYRQRSLSLQMHPGTDGGTAGLP